MSNLPGRDDIVESMTCPVLEISPVDSQGKVDFLASRRYGYRSPLRYPGGKASLAGTFSDIFSLGGMSDVTYVEPYAGGAGAGICLLLENRVSKLVINDLDPAVFAFWQGALEETDRFLERVETVSLTVDEWKKQRSIYKDEHSKGFDLGFAFFYLNRTNRSGILSAGVIGGLKQQGKDLIDARFNRKSLTEKITAIAEKRDAITISFEDGRRVISDYAGDENVFFYVDPPYVKAGASLYMNSFQYRDHESLAKILLKNRESNWILTYDADPLIEQLYRGCFSHLYSLNYSAHVPGKAQELVIASDSMKRFIH